MPTSRRALLRFAAAAPIAWTGSASAIEVQQEMWPLHMRESSDPIWPTLGGAAIDFNPETGALSARFTDTIRRLDGASLTVGGFYWPLSTTMTARHFLLTRRNQSCKFCPGNEITDSIEVFSSRPIPFTQDPIEVSGHFKLVSLSQDGFFFQLHGAEVRPG